MYSDHHPCAVCGADVELRGREPGSHPDDAVAEPDGPVDERFCTNPDCPTHQPGPQRDVPRP